MQIRENKKNNIISAVLLYAAPVAGAGIFCMFSKGDGISILSNIVVTLILAGIFYTLLHMNQGYLYGRIYNPLLYFGCFFLSFVLLGGKAGLPLGVFWMLAVVIAALDSGLELAIATHAVLMVQYAVLLFPKDNGFYRFSAYILLGIVVALLFSQLLERRAIPYMILILLSCDGVLQCVVYQFNLKEISAHPVEILVELFSLLVFVVIGYLYLGYRKRYEQAEDFYEEEELSEKELEAEREELFLEGQAKKLREAFPAGGSDLFAEGLEDEPEEEQPEGIREEDAEEKTSADMYRESTGEVQPVDGYEEGAEETQPGNGYMEEPVQSDLYIGEQANGDLFAEGQETESVEEPAGEKLTEESFEGGQSEKSAEGPFEGEQSEESAGEPFEGELTEESVDGQFNESVEEPTGEFAKEAGEQPVEEQSGEFAGIAGEPAEDGLAEESVKDAGEQLQEKEPEGQLMDRLQNLTEPGFELLEYLKEYSGDLYRHSERIAILSEKAAQAVGGNAVLAKAGGFYHDIGHVEEDENYIEAGVRIGQEYGFPEELLAVIRQHSTGSTLPQSIEAAVVMLSDCIISTSDFLAKSGKREMVSNQKLVTSIFQNRLEKGDLEQSGMTGEQIQLLKEFYVENTFTEG